MGTLELPRGEVPQQPHSMASGQPELLHSSLDDPVSSISDDLLGTILLLVASNGSRFDTRDSLLNNETILQSSIEDAFNEHLPGENVLFGLPEPPVATASSLTAFRHALVCKRWLRVARSVHPAIVVPRDRFFCSKTLASLLVSPTSGFPNLRHLHLGEFATDVVNRHLVRSICDGCGSSLTHLTVHLYDRQPVTAAQPAGSNRGPEQPASLDAPISPSEVADIFNSCTRLVNLDVRLGEAASEIPPSISRLQQLTRLSMSFSNVTGLPEELFNLLGLKQLHIASQSLRVLPISIGCLTSLEYFALRNCPIGQLPSDILQLHNLKILTLSYLPSLVALPESICLLPVLSHISLDHCPQFTSLPENIFQLPDLHTLKLDRLAALTALPEPLGQLLADQPLGSPVLRHLSLRNCPLLSALPEDIGQFSSLQQLHLMRLDQLTALPHSLGFLSALKELKVVECGELESLPESVSAMEALTSLILDGCNLSSLPGDIGQLHNLVAVKLFSRRLSHLPDSFGQLGQLKELTIHKCYDLYRIPASFANLSSLENLIIYGGSSLTHLPPDFERLPKLCSLELLNCAISCLPDSFGELPNLKIFKLQTTDEYERIGVESEPGMLSAHLGYQSEGEECQLEGFCSLRRFPKSFSLLSRLEQLIINGCAMLVELPRGLGNLRCLKVLKVENCERLKFFPSLLPSAAAAAAAGPAEGRPSAPAATSSSAIPAPLPLLVELVISSCPILRNIPEGLHLLPSLERFTLEHCTSPKLANLCTKSVSPPTCFSSSSASPALPPSITLPHSVQSVTISNVFGSAHHLPESFLSLIHLRHLNLYNLRSLKHLKAPAPLKQTPAKAETEVEIVPHAPLDDRPKVPGSIGQAGLGHLSSLVHLHIVNSNLPALPKNLGDLKELRVLLLERCQSMTSLPASMTTLPKLQQIDLKSLRRLSHLPENLGQLKALKYLRLESCRSLGNLPPSFTQLSSLIVLSIVNCLKITCLPGPLSSFTRLSSLKLNRLTGLRLLPSPFSLPSLKQLSLRDCKRLRALPCELGSLSCLREVDLDGCWQVNLLPQSLADRMHVIEMKGAWGGYC